MKKGFTEFGCISYKLDKWKKVPPTVFPQLVHKFLVFIETVTSSLRSCKNVLGLTKIDFNKNVF